MAFKDETSIPSSPSSPSSYFKKKKKRNVNVNHTGNTPSF